MFKFFCRNVVSVVLFCFLFVGFFESWHEDYGALQKSLLLESRSTATEAQLRIDTQTYIDILSQGDDLTGENRPDIFQLLGNFDAVVFVKFAKMWREQFFGVPILCVGGYGIATREFLAQTLSYYKRRGDLTPEEEEWLSGAIKEVENAHGENRGFIDPGDVVERSNLANRLRTMQLRCNEFVVKGATEAHVLEYILRKEGIDSKYIHLEEVPSADTRLNFENNIELIKKLSGGTGKSVNIGIVTAPYKLLRAGVVSQVEWAGNPNSRNFRPVRVKVYDIDASNMQPHDLINTLHIVIGGSQKYRRKYAFLFKSSELRTARSVIAKVSSPESAAEFAMSADELKTLGLKLQALLRGISWEDLSKKEQMLQNLLEKYVDELYEGANIYYSIRVNGFIPSQVLPHIESCA